MKRLLLLIILLMSFSLMSCKENTEPSIDKPKTDPDLLPNGMLFEHGITGEDKFYNYCPTIFEEDGVRHIYYCSNKQQGNVTDYIFYRKGVKNEFGTWKYSDYSIVLEPTMDTWDERHTCDPTVIKGEFKYNNEDYNYLMSYLGCVTSNNQGNEVGIAVAKKPEGPWIKVDEVNPICPFTMKDAPNLFQWGNGQPSLVSYDLKGIVLLFYTVGDGTSTYTKMDKYDLSNLNEIKKLDEKIITTKGVKTSNNTQDSINNADFAYDHINDRMYVISDGHPYGPEYPDMVASFNGLYYFNNGTKQSNPGDSLFSPLGASWVNVCNVNKAMTSFDRNHNMGIVTDPYGRLLSQKEIEIVYTGTSISSSFWGAHATYRLYSITINIENV